MHHVILSLKKVNINLLNVHNFTKDIFDLYGLDPENVTGVTIDNINKINYDFPKKFNYENETSLSSVQDTGNTCGKQYL